MIGLIFVLIWEGLAGGFLSGVAWLSVGQGGIRIGHEVSASLDDPVNLPWALLASLAVTVGKVWFRRRPAAVVRAYRRRVAASAGRRADTTPPGGCG